MMMSPRLSVHGPFTCGIQDHVTSGHLFDFVNFVVSTENACWWNRNDWTGAATRVSRVTGGILVSWDGLFNHIRLTSVLEERRYAVLALARVLRLTYNWVGRLTL